MSAQYLSALVIVLITILPMFGVKIGTDELTSFLQALITVIGGIVIMVKRYKQGGITGFGFKK